MPKKTQQTLTEFAIKSAKAPAQGRIEVWDNVVPGFGLRISHTGHKSWMLLYRDAQGAKCRAILGTYPDVGLSDARFLAKQKYDAAKSGVDVKKERQQEKAEQAANALTVHDLAEDFLKSRTSPTERKPLRPSTARHYRCSLNKWILPRMGARTVASLTDRDLIVLMKDIVAAMPIKDGEPQMTPAIQAYACLSSMFRWAKKQKIIRVDLMEDMEKPADTPTRERYLTPEEIAAVWDAATHEEIGQAAFFTLGLLTAMRLGEIRTMTWDRVNLEEGWVFIPKEIAKNKKQYYVMLSRPAIEILQELKDVYGGEGYVIPGKVEGQPYDQRGLHRCLDRVRELSGIKDFTFHDFRRTMGTHMGDLGYTQADVGLLLNHSQEDSTAGKNYMKGKRFDYKRQLSEAWTSWLINVVAPIPSMVG